MLDFLLGVGSIFDWITPLWAFLLDLVYGPAGDFGVDAYAGWGRRDIERLLKRHGVKVWGLMYTISGDVLMFTVNRAQAELTYMVLQYAGVPILYAPVSPT